MYCPVCKRKTEGKVCEFCGAVLELDENYMLNPYEKTTENPPENTTPSHYNTRNGIKITDTKKKAPQKRKPLVFGLGLMLFVIIALVAAIIIVSISGNKADNEEAKKASTSEDLSLKGEKYMDIGDYEAAEEAYRELMEISYDEETILVYKILYNYNRAVQKLDEYDFHSASKFFEKIPLEYTEYAIYDDVETLSDEIARFQTAYEIFESIENFMANKNFAAAKETIGILDEDSLSKENKESLKEIKKEIAEHEKNEIILSQHDAEDLLLGYCDSFVKAINQQNFDIVAPFIHKESEMFSKQKKLIESYIANKITQSFDSFKLVSLTKSSETTWQARVSESETISYANGTSESKSFSWIYTIEYIDSSFYLTAIR